jgi:hypothetical protein
VLSNHIPVILAFGPARYSESGRLTKVRLTPVGQTTPKITSLGDGMAEVEILIGGYYPVPVAPRRHPLQGWRPAWDERRLQQAGSKTKAAAPTGGGSGPLEPCGPEGNKSPATSVTHLSGN